MPSPQRDEPYRRELTCSDPTVSTTLHDREMLEPEWWPYRDYHAIAFNAQQSERVSTHRCLDLSASPARPHLLG